MENVLVLVRHGESEWNKLNLFTGWRDVGLTETGHRRGAPRGQAHKGPGLPFRHRVHERAETGAAHA